MTKDEIDEMLKGIAEDLSEATRETREAPRMEEFLAKGAVFMTLASMASHLKIPAKDFAAFFTRKGFDKALDYLTAVAEYKIDEDAEEMKETLRKMRKK